MVELLASDFRPIVQTAFAVSVCVAAFLWGRGPERAIAIVWLVLFEIALHFYQVAFAAGPRLTNVDLFLASLDGFAVALFILIALNANRTYPLCIAALQVLAITAHLARGLIEAISPIAYAIMVIGPGWLQLMIFTVGIARHVQRERRWGQYREWRRSAVRHHPVPAGVRVD